MVEKIIAKERQAFPQETMAILPTMGGQTALNCALDLHQHGVLAKYGVEMIGANADVIDKAESRERFQEPRDRGVVPAQLDVVRHARDPDEVERPVADDLVSDVDVARPRVTGLRNVRLHDSSLLDRVCCRHHPGNQTL